MSLPRRSADGRFAPGSTAESGIELQDEPSHPDYWVRATKGLRTEWSSFDRCKPAARDLAAAARSRGEQDVEVIRVQGDLTNSSGGHPAWDRVRHENRVHYVTRIGDQIVDLTARQFDRKADCPLVYPADDLGSKWSQASIEDV